MSQYLVLFTIVLLITSSSAQAVGNRVEELIIWKISEELKLDPEKEKKFSQIIRGYNSQKKSLNLEIEKLVGEMSSHKSSEKRTGLLKEYRSQILKYSKLSIDELDEIQSVLGPEKTAEYLILRKDLSNKIKTLISMPESSASKGGIRPPQIIEEK